jgi:hypothetical protein
MGGKSVELIFSVFKENVSELELEIIHLQTDLSLKTRVNDRLLKSNVMCTVSYSKMSSIKGECVFWFYLLKWIRLFSNENTKVKVQIIINCKHLNVCMIVALTKYSPNYDKLAVSNIALNSVALIGWAVLLRKHYIH